MKSTTSIKATVYFENVAPQTIMMWTQPTIPNGWQICNGKHGTPDLRDKFVIGSTGTGGAYPLNQPGGTNQISLQVSNMPAGFPELTDNGHAHPTSMAMGYAYVQGLVGSGTTGLTSTSGGTGAGTKTLQADSTNSYTSIDISQGSGQAITHDQPYYALYYIQKI